MGWLCLKAQPIHRPTLKFLYITTPPQLLASFWQRSFSGDVPYPRKKGAALYSRYPTSRRADPVILPWTGYGLCSLHYLKAEPLARGKAAFSRGAPAPPDGLQLPLMVSQIQLSAAVSPSSAG